MVLNATFNTISVISWWSVLLMEETGENQRPPANQNEYHAQSRISRPFQIILTYCSFFLVGDCVDRVLLYKFGIYQRDNQKQYIEG
jgi:hypothetical protein